MRGVDGPPLFKPIEIIEASMIVVGFLSQNYDDLTKALNLKWVNQVHNF